MNAKQIEQHVPILGAIHLIGGALFVVIGGFVFFLLTGKRRQQITSQL